MKKIANIADYRKSISCYIFYNKQLKDLINWLENQTDNIVGEIDESFNCVTDANPKN